MEIVPAPKSKKPSVYEVMTWLERKRDKLTKSKSEYAHWNKSYQRQIKRQAEKKLGFEIEVSHAVKAMAQGRWLMATMYLEAARAQVNHEVDPERWLLYAFIGIEIRLAWGEPEMAVNGAVMSVYYLSDWLGWDHPCTMDALLRASRFEKRSPLITALLEKAAENGVKELKKP